MTNIGADAQAKTDLSVAFCAGEPSGDRYAAALLDALRRELGAERPVRAWGIGGVHMALSGVSLVADSRDWGAIGVVEAIKKVPGMLPANQALRRKLRQSPPDALVLVDFGAFNVPVARWVKKNGLCPVFYYMPPGSWKRVASAKGLATLAGVSDLIVTPFPWSERHLKEAGANARFFGHPLLDLVHPSTPVQVFDDKYGLDPTRLVITLLPGSRAHELENVLPVLLSAAGEIVGRVPGAQFLLGLAPNISPDDIADILRREQARGSAAKLLNLMQEAGGRIRRAASAAITVPPVGAPKLATAEGFSIDPGEVEQEKKLRRQPEPRGAAHGMAPLAIVVGQTYDAISRADLVIACSGTATLETAILNRPMLIVYRGGKMMEMEWRLRKNALALKFIGLPNILADRLICPEFIQDQATPHAIADAAVEMILQPDRLMKMKAELTTVVKEQLGEPGGIERTARCFIDEVLSPATMSGRPATRH